MVVITLERNFLFRYSSFPIYALHDTVVHCSINVWYWYSA